METHVVRNQSLEPEPINIRFKGEYALLSNLAESPFTLDDVTYNSVEAFIQVIKIPEDDARRPAIISGHGNSAKSSLKNRNKSIEKNLKQGKDVSVYHNGETIEYRSLKHLELIESAIRAKFDQNPEAKALLLSTGTAELTHKLSDRPENPYTSLPARAFCMILTQLRAEYRTEAAGTNQINLSEFQF